MRVLAPPSRLALIIGAWFVSRGISISYEVAAVGSAIRDGFVIMWAWLVLQGISKSSEFAGVGSAIVIRFDYPGLVCNTRGI